MINLWVEKYRPKNFDDIILSPENKKFFEEYQKNNCSHNLLLYGPAGVGKTTVVKNLIKNKNYEFIWLNGSDERGINVVREQIKNFISVKTLQNVIRKLVIIDEGEALTIDAFQALKGLIEEYYKIASFIITTNFLYKVPEALQSRFILIEFKKISKDNIINYLKNIAKNEQVTYTDELLEKIYNISCGDLRKAINYLYKYSVLNKLDISNDNYVKILKFINDKNINGLKKFLNKNEINYAELYRFLYENIEDAQMLVLLGKYFYQSHFVIDQEINFVTFCCDLIKLFNK